MYNVYNENKSYKPEITDEIQVFYYILAIIIIKKICSVGWIGHIWSVKLRLRTRSLILPL